MRKKTGVGGPRANGLLTCTRTYVLIGWKGCCPAAAALLPLAASRFLTRPSTYPHVMPSCSSCQDRVRLAYRQSLAYFYRFPEVWADFALHENETDDAEAAAGKEEEERASAPCRVVSCTRGGVK